MHRCTKSLIPVASAAMEPNFDLTYLILPEVLIPLIDFMILAKVLALLKTLQNLPAIAAFSAMKRATPAAHLANKMKSGSATTGNAVAAVKSMT